MGKSKKRERKKQSQPVTSVSKISHKKKSAVIHELHLLNKKSEKLIGGDGSEQGVALQQINEKIDKLGGLAAYQWVSKSAEGHHGNFNSAKWVTEQLRNQGALPTQDGAKLQLLDVGALDLNYEGQKKMMEATAIDLNPQNPQIMKRDFLKFREGSSCVYDVIVLSLVINFIGDIKKRGDMLRRAAVLCRINGYLVVVLPLACVNNSRYMTHEHLETMVASLGFTLVTAHNSRKLSFKLFQKHTSSHQHRMFPKKKLRDGKTMNNFTIVLR